MHMPVGSFVAFVAALFACSGASAQSLARIARAGGLISQPVTVGDYLYVPAGAGIDVWNLADPAHPVHAGRTDAGSETPGEIRDLATAANRLYANWTGAPNGVAVYSLADPAHPLLVGEVDGADAEAIETDGAWLYLAGNSIGLLSFSLADPDAPVRAGTADEFIAGYVIGFAVTGQRGVLTTENGFGDPFGLVLDLADPMHPHATSTPPLCGLDCIVDGDFVFSFGAGFGVFDLHDAANPELVFNDFGGISTRGALDGDTLWVFGDDVEAWDVAAPAHPVLRGTAAIETPNPVHATLTSKGAYAVDAAGNGTLVDPATPTAPNVLARIDVPGGGPINGAALDARYAYLADPAFGLRIVSSPSLEPVASIAIDEAEVRGAHDVVVANGIAYVVGWVSLWAVDVSDPRHPTVLGSVATPAFMQRVVVEGDRAYLSTYNQLTTLAIADIADPANMRVLGSMFVDNPRDIVVRNRRVYIASEGGSEITSGLRIVDVANPAAPVQIGADATCGAVAIARSVAFLDDTGTTLALGCEDGSVHLLDVSDAAAPAPLGSLALADEFNGALSLAVSRHHLYVGHYVGVDDFDLTDRESPHLVARYPASSPIYTERSASNAFMAVSFLGGTYSYSRTDVASAHTHSHHTRPARPSFEL
jgi:hypothetical protein